MNETTKTTNKNFKIIAFVLGGFIALIGISYAVTMVTRPTPKEAPMTDDERITIIYDQIATIEKDTRAKRLEKDQLTSKLNVVNGGIEANNAHIVQLNIKLDEIRFSGLAYLGFTTSSQAQ